MGRIDKKVVRLLLGKKPKSTVYRLIKKIRKDSGYKITSNEGAYLLAGQLGIDIAELLNRKELDRIRSLQIQTPVTVVTKEAPKNIHRTINLGKFKLRDPLLPESLLEEARKMSGDVYPVFYVFENSARNLIQTVMEQEHGESWWEKKVPKKIKERVAERQRRENKNKWHGRRNAREIFYTDFGDLNDIILANWGDFKKLFPRQDWITSKFSDLELSRNTIAHNNPLQKSDIRRVELYFSDWMKQLDFDKAYLQGIPS